MVRPEGLGKLKKFKVLIRSRTRNLSSCSITPQPSTLPRALGLLSLQVNKIEHNTIQLKIVFTVGVKVDESVYGRGKGNMLYKKPEARKTTENLDRVGRCKNHTEHTDTVRTSQETHYVSATQTTPVNAVWGKQSLFIVRTVLNTDTLCGQNAEC
jgi:hypothetical protein